MGGAQGQFQTPSPLQWGWGQRRVVKPANPAAGADWTFTGQGSMKVRLLSAVWTFVASAQVPKRVPTVGVLDGDGNLIAQYTSGSEIGAGGTNRVTAALAGPNFSTAAARVVPICLPDIHLSVGYTLVSLTEGIQTEDKIESVRLWVEEFEQVPEHPIEELVRAYRKVRELEGVLTHAAG